MQNFCQSCGQPLKPEDKICTNCGNPASPPKGSPAYGTPPSTSTPGSYQPPTQTPPGHPQANANVIQAQVRTLFALTMVFSLIAGIMLLVFDFGGWYNYDAYHHIREYGWVGPFVNQFSFIPFLLVACSLFFCSYISYRGFSSKSPTPRNIVMRGFIISIVVLAVILIGGVALFIATSEANSTWLEAGFYGGAIGSLLTALCFGLILKNTSHTAPQKRTAYRAPAPSSYYPPQSTQPPAQMPGPSMTQPAGQPAPAPQPTAQEPAVSEPTRKEEPTQAAPQDQQQAQQPQQQAQQLPQQQYPPTQQQYQQPYQQSQYQTPASYPCPKCGRLMRFINEYKKWYCDNCRRYL